VEPTCRNLADENLPIFWELARSLGSHYLPEAIPIPPSVPNLQIAERTEGHVHWTIEDQW